MSVLAVIRPKRLSLLAGESFNMNNERWEWRIRF